jgi:sulfur-carrier protein
VPNVKLFAQAREAAGTSTLEVGGATVGEVLDALRTRFGAGFGEVLDVSRVWCNGEPAEVSTPVAGPDEVAVLPPVSGG